MVNVALEGNRQVVQEEFKSIKGACSTKKEVAWVEKKRLLKKYDLLYE